MFLRLTPMYVVALRGDAEQVGYIINTNSMSVIDSLGKGFNSATCAIYSKRYQGLFIGHLSGIVGFLPLPPQYTEPTAVREHEQLRLSETITSCDVYTLQGSKVAEAECDGELSTMQMQRLSLPYGCYLAVYHTTSGETFSRKIIVW